MSAHTPGPWKNCRDANGNCIICQSSEVLPGEISYSEEFQANRRLVDAAPDLLALAHQYAAECGDCAGTRVCPDDEPCTACADVWAVIDAAEGRAA